MTDDEYVSEVEYGLTWSGSPGDGHDPLQTFAMTVLAAHKQARLAGGTATVSQLRIQETDDAGRATRITARLSLRAVDAQLLREASDTIRRQAGERADRDGTSLQVVAHGHGYLASPVGSISHSAAPPPGRPVDRYLRWRCPPRLCSYRHLHDGIDRRPAGCGR